MEDICTNWNCLPDCGYLFLLITPKEYEFTARMQLIGNNQSMMSEMKMLKSSGIGALLGGSASGISVEDEIIILMSRTNMTEAILQTQYQVEVRQRHGMKNILLYGKDSPITFLFPQQFLDTVSEPIRMKITLLDGKIQSAKIQSKLFKTVKLTEQPLPTHIQLPVGTIVITSNNDTVSGEQTINCQITPLQKYTRIYMTICMPEPKKRFRILYC